MKRDYVVAGDNVAAVMTSVMTCADVKTVTVTRPPMYSIAQRARSRTTAHDIEVDCRQFDVSYVVKKRVSSVV